MRLPLLLTLSSVFASPCFGGLLEIKLTGEITTTRPGDLYPLPTSIRPGKPISASYSVNDYWIENSIYSGGVIEIQPRAPFRYTVSNEEWAANGSLKYKDNVAEFDSSYVLSDTVEVRGIEYGVIYAPHVFLQKQDWALPPDTTPVPYLWVEQGNAHFRLKMQGYRRDRNGNLLTNEKAFEAEIVGTFTDQVATRYEDGDSNKDGVFNQLDIVQVLQHSLYLTEQPAIWDDGDWNGDGVFDQLDIIAALPNYGAAPSAAMVPEPASICLLILGLLLLPYRLMTTAPHTHS